MLTFTIPQSEKNVQAGENENLRRVARKYKKAQEGPPLWRQPAWRYGINRGKKGFLIKRKREECKIFRTGPLEF